MIAGIPKETFPGQNQVALVPDHVATLKKAGLEIMIEAGAGNPAGYPDELYKEKGAQLAGSRKEVFQRSDIILQVQAFGANPEKGMEDLELIREGQAVVAFLDPLAAAESVKKTRRAQAESIFNGADAPDHQGPEHGRPVFTGHCGRL